MPRLTDRPSLREWLPDSQWFAAGGGVLFAMVMLALANVTRVASSLDHAAWDRIATALADTPLPAELLVVQAPARSADWKLAAVALRLDSAGARVVALAADLSVAVPPAGAIPDVVMAPHTLLPYVITGRTTSGTTGGRPWFLTDSLERQLSLAGKYVGSVLVRDADGVVRHAAMPEACPRTFARQIAATLRTLPACRSLPTAFSDAPDMLLRFSRSDTGWYGATTIPIDSVLAMDLATVRRAASGHAVIVGIDDGSTVPTAVGAMASLAVLVHEVADAADGRAPIVEAGILQAIGWVCAWLMVGVTVVALLALQWTLVVTAVCAVLLVAGTVWIVDVHSTWLPLGQSMLALLAGVLGAQLVSLWQARRQRLLTSLLFSRFVTPALAEQAWERRHVYLQGGRPAPLQLPVTVLFVDLRGFTRFSESAEPARVMQLITDVTAACAADIAACGGLVDDFAGDGIKADFGVPVPRTEPAQVRADAAAAVRCAGLLAATIARLLPPDIGTAGVQARVGIHSGMALAGTVGGGTRLKYTVVGDVVNVAARLQALDLPDASANRCPIIVSSEALALLDAVPDGAEDLGLLQLSGRTHPVHAWRLRGAARTTS